MNIFGKPGLGGNFDWEEPVAGGGGGGSANASGGGSAVASIPDWKKLDTIESLIKLFENHEMTSIDPTFGFCVGIHSDSNIETAYDKVRANPSIKLGSIFAGVTDYDAMLTVNPWLKVWLTQKFISTYRGAIIMDVYEKHAHLLGDDINELNTTRYSCSIDMHGDLNINDNISRRIRRYNNVNEILFGTLPKTTLLFNPRIFDETVKSEKSNKEIISDHREIIIKILTKFIIKRDECQVVVKEISNKITECHKKIQKLQNLQQLSQIIGNASQEGVNADEIVKTAEVIVKDAEVIVKAIVEEISNEVDLTIKDTASTPPFSHEDNLTHLTKNMNELYYALGTKLKELEDLVQEVRETHISLRSALYYNLLNPDEALGYLDQTIFSGTNEENGGLGCVIYLKETQFVTNCVRHYLQNTNDNKLSFVGDGLTFTVTVTGNTFNAYNPSEAMKFNLWNPFRNSECGMYPSFAWLFFVYCILKKNNGILPDEAIQVLTMTLFDDCTHSKSDNAISKILRTQYMKGNTTDIKSELLYSFLESVGIEYDLKLLHCMGKPSSDSIEDFKTKVTKFGDKYIAPEFKAPFDRRIDEIGATQTLGSQESMQSQIDYFADVLSQKTQTLLQMIQTSSQNTNYIDFFSQPEFQTLSLSELLTAGGQSATGGGGGSSQENNPTDFLSQISNPFETGSKTGGGSQNYNVTDEDKESQGDKLQIEVMAANSEDEDEEEKNLFPLSQKHFNPNLLKPSIIEVKKGIKNANTNTNVTKKVPKGAKKKVKGGRKTRRPKKNKRTRRTKDRAKYTRKR